MHPARVQKSFRSYWGPLLAAVFIGLGTGATLAQNLDGFAAKKGERIYLKGVGSTPLVARVAGGEVEVPGRMFPCVNCHKADGLGHREGGLKARDITWFNLTKSLESGGRGYDDATIARAIREGLDAAGHSLSNAMPRYRMDTDDMAATVAYLRTLDEGTSPGVSGEDVRVATLLPLRGSMAEVGRLIERFLNLAVLDVNTRRRFDGRRITLVSVPFDADIPGDALRAAKYVIETDPPFCFLSNFGIPANDGTQRFIADAGILNLAPIAVPLTSDDRSAIWIEPSVADQARALVEWVSQERSHEDQPVRIAIVFDGTPMNLAAAEAARDKIAHVPAVLVVDQAFAAPLSKIVETLRDDRVDAILLFVPFEAAAGLTAETVRQNWRPLLLGRWQELQALEHDASLTRNANFYLVASYGGVEPRSRGAYDFRRVAGELGGGHPDLLRDAYVGSKLLEAGLARTGRRLTRASFIAAIDQLHDFSTGVLAPLSFDSGASRRSAAVVMQLDPERGRLIPLAPGRNR